MSGYEQSDDKPQRRSWMGLTERAIFVIIAIVVLIVGALSLYVFGTVATQ